MVILKIDFFLRETQQTNKKTKSQILNAQDVKFNCCVVLQANVFSFVAANCRKEGKKEK